MSTVVESAMGESGILENEIAAGPIDWDLVFPNIPDDPSLFDPSLLSGLSDSPDSFSISIGDIERLLMEDEGNCGGDKAADEQQPFEFPDDFLADFLLDLPVESDRSAEVVDLVDRGQISNSFSSGEEKERGKIDAVPLDSPVESDRSPEVFDLPDGGKISNSSSSAEEGDQEKVDNFPRKDIMTNNNINKMGDGDNSDPTDKKRQRQLRNRDAAVRSRERRKSYVRDLEIKTRYLEGECRRLGMLLQCCSAENQALRLSMHNASMTKQESAVLLLESLLLGSLLWFLGIVCLFLARPLQLNLEAVQPGNVDKTNLGRPAPRKAENEMFGLLLQEFPSSFMVSKRCKASRSRMKPISLMLEVLVRLS